MSKQPLLKFDVTGNIIRAAIATGRSYRVYEDAQGRRFGSSVDEHAAHAPRMPFITCRYVMTIKPKVKQ